MDNVQDFIAYVYTGIFMVQRLIFADNMILHIENPKDSTKKLPERINEISKVGGYKINIQKSVFICH